ncbi:MAG TPA: ComEC/Rec2 family competence protein [Saprospiraceae bacterium]|nr:ComEC/Rec2 family competence protein [Saprospiraceae bacterium]
MSGIPWRMAPMVRPTLALIAGIYIFDQSQWSLCIGFMMYLVVSLGILYVFKLMVSPQRRAIFLSILTLILYFFLGGIRVGGKNMEFPNHYTRYISEENYIIATVVEPPVKKNRIRAEVLVQWIGVDPMQLKRVSGKILVYFPGDYEFMPPLGTQIIMRGKLNEVNRPGNPHAFDYRLYLSRRGIRHQIFLKKDHIQIADRTYQIKTKEFLNQWRAYFTEQLEKYMQTEESVGIASAMVLGYKNKLPEETYQAYSDTGAVHTLAVSGLHVGIIAIILSWMVLWLPVHLSIGRIFRAVFLVSGIWLYALLTGGSPSVVRAATMFSIIAIDYSWAQHKNIFNSMAVAALLMTLYDPHVIYQPGFQLSFFALGGIVIFYKPIYDCFPSFKVKALRYLWGLIAVSFAAQIGVFPISVYYFNKFPTYFWLGSMVAIPAAFVILSLGLALLFLSTIHTQLAVICGFILHYVIQYLNQCIFWIKGLPLGLIEGLWLESYDLLCIYLVIGLSGYGIRLKHSRSLKSAILVYIVFLSTLIIRSIVYHHQEKLVVYDISGSTIIDIIDGNKIYTIKNGDLADESEHFQCRNYRMSVRGKKFGDINMDSVRNGHRFVFNRGFIINGNKNILIVRENSGVTFQGDVNILIITSLYKGSPEYVYNNYRPELIIVDQSLDYRSYLKWVDFSEKTEIVRFVKNEGAIILKL